jgi:hypothetical protein
MLRTAEMVVLLLETHQTSVAILWRNAERRAIASRHQDAYRMACPVQRANMRSILLAMMKSFSCTALTSLFALTRVALTRARAALRIPLDPARR